jgi:hypothetical protein
MIDQLPSRFLHEIPAHLIPVEDCSYWSLPQVHQFCADWLVSSSAKAPAYIYIPSYTKTTNTTTAIKPRRTNKTTLETTETKSHASSCIWKKNQPVKHVKYGVGTIQEIEEKTTGDTHLTVRFKVGVKKIVAQFVQRL